MSQQLNLVPSALDISIYQSGSYSPIFTAFNTDQFGQSTTPLNLSGYTAALNVYSKPGATPALLTLSTANGKIVLGGAAGTVQLQFLAADLGALPAGTLYYDLVLINGSNVPLPCASGLFVVIGPGGLQ